MSAPKTALVTGSSRGIGLALCRELQSRGWNVIATCRKPSDVDSEPFWKKVQLCVEDDESIGRMKAEIRDLPIDLLINNAGILSRGFDTLASLNREALLHELNVDAVSPLLVCKALEENLVKAHGSIINITSLLGSIQDCTSGKYYPYRAAKTALNMMTKALALEMKGRLKSVVAVHPGFVGTDMVGGSRPGSISPEEAAKCIVDTYEALEPSQNGCCLSRLGKIEPCFKIEQRQRIKQMEQNIAHLRKSTSDLKARHIELLHDYNDIKDFCQFLLGRLAQMEETTVSALYPRFGLDRDD